MLSSGRGYCQKVPCCTGLGAKMHAMPGKAGTEGPCGPKFQFRDLGLRNLGSEFDRSG